MSQLRRAEIMAVARTQESDARCINPWRGMARRGKRLGAKKVRQHLKRGISNVLRLLCRKELTAEQLGDYR